MKHQILFSFAAVVLAGRVAASVDCSNPYGACAHVTRGEPVARTCEMMRQAGMGWVRSDFDWRGIERKPGVWNFSRVDAVVDGAAAQGIQLLPILGYGVPEGGEAHEHLDRWTEYVRQVVTRYGHRLPVLEVWNEENIPGFWKSPNPTNYFSLLKRTYETVKKIDPSLRVSFGGTAGVPFNFIEEVYRLGGAKYFDILSIHPYSHPRRPEGVLDVQIEKLRGIMAKYGDAEKKIWITEVGWPTHQVNIGTSGLLIAGLRTARADRQAWRVLYVPARSESADSLVRDSLLKELPDGSTVEVCASVDLGARLEKGSVDAIVYPFSEDYPSDTVDAVHAFVKAGGVLVDFGGMPLWNAWRAGPDGVMCEDGKASPSNDRRRLRISETAWWINKRYPETIQVYPTAEAVGIRTPPKGFEGCRFLTDRFLKPGDRLVPLLTAETNGLTAVAAGVYLFNSDMKGAVVVSGLFNRSAGTSDEARQARMYARALGIAFAEKVEAYFCYEFRQPDNDPYDPESFFGIVHDNFSPKPAYGAYMTFIDQRPVGSVNTEGAWRSPDGKDYFPQWKRPGGESAGMIWTIGTSGFRTLTFTTDRVTFLDAAGARVRPVRNGTGYRVYVSDTPVYFRGGTLKQH